MKINKLLILLILALAVMTIGAVSASDNITDEAVPSDNEDALSEEIPHNLEGDDWPSEIDIRCHYEEKNVLKDEPIYFVKTICGGKMEVSIDGVPKTATFDGADEVDEVYSIPTKGLPVGEHILNVKIKDDAYYGNVSKNLTFYISNIVTYVPDSIVIDEITRNDMAVRVNSDDAGKLVVSIDDMTYTYKDVSSISKTYSLNDLSAFDNPHIIKVTFTTAKGVVYNETFVVNTTYFYMWDRDIKYYNDRFYSIIVPSQFSKDKIKVKIDGEAYELIETYSIYYNVDVSGLDLGDHSIVVSYDGDDKFAPCSSSAKISVYPYLTFSDDYITVDEKISVESYVPVSNSTFSVYVDGKLYESKSFSDISSSTQAFKRANIVIDDLKVGVHKITAVISGDYSYRYTKNVQVYVDINGPSSLDVGQSGNFIVNFPNATGNLTADYGSQKVTAQFINGTANVTIPSTLKVGQYEVRFIYDDVNNPFNVSDILFIDPVFHVPGNVINGKGSIYMTLPYDDPKGKFTVEIYNKKDKYVLSAKFIDKKASIPLTSLNAGTYTVFPKYFNGTDWFYHGVVEMTVRNTKLTASDLTKYYGSSTAFKVKVADYNGKLVKGKYVKFYINGKYVKKVKTNKYGYAILKIGKAPGSYKISAKYGKVQITRKLTVKHAVTLKTVTVKKSAKSLTLKVTLKKGKTPIKYKYVKFYFNGKFIKKVKTSKYGIAKVTIKNTVLKKLKVGKTVKYQATYLKDTVKKSAVVKK